MDRRVLLVISGVLVAGVFIVVGFGFAYDIYTSQQNCQEMDDQRRVTANCWAFPSRLLVAGGLLLGVCGIGLGVVSGRWYRRG